VAIGQLFACLRGSLAEDGDACRGVVAEVEVPATLRMYGDSFMGDKDKGGPLEEITSASCSSSPQAVFLKACTTKYREPVQN
jgi:hypothetical protein